MAAGGALHALIREVPDFPRPGIVFRDITPLIADAAAFRQSLEWMERLAAAQEAEAVVGIESRGFIFGAALAARLGVGFIPVRKEGKLPHAAHAEEYLLEYGSSALEIHKDALREGERTLIVDDLLATGGTAKATTTLVQQTGAVVAGLAFLVELGDLDGRSRLQNFRVDALITY